VGWDFSVSAGVHTPAEMPRSGNKVVSKERSGLRISDFMPLRTFSKKRKKYLFYTNKVSKNEYNTLIW
jgi:hypothetical protein